jgi:hypothetical protein
MYDASVPVFSRMLQNLGAILEKAAAHAEARKIDPAVLIQARLYPDMLPFAVQIYIATDTAKGAAARLAGQTPPRYEDVEITFPDLISRINKTLDYLATFKPEHIEGSEERDIYLKFGTQEVRTKGLPYLLHQATPNFYFHITTAYAILRHNGVELGKKDYLGRE